MSNTIKVWKITVEGVNTRVQWVEKTFTNRNHLQDYLDYFHVNNYNGPGLYNTCDGFCYKIEFFNDTK